MSSVVDDGPGLIMPTSLTALEGRGKVALVGIYVMYMSGGRVSREASTWEHGICRRTSATTFQNPNSLD